MKFSHKKRQPYYYKRKMIWNHWLVAFRNVNSDFEIEHGVLTDFEIAWSKYPLKRNIQKWHFANECFDEMKFLLFWSIFASIYLQTIKLTFFYYFSVRKSLILQVAGIKHLSFSIFGKFFCCWWINDFIVCIKLKYSHLFPFSKIQAWKSEKWGSPGYLERKF